MNRPDLMALLGHPVTVTNPDVGTTWTGDLIAIADDPSLVIYQADGSRMTLPQRFTVTRLDDEASAVELPQGAVDAAGVVLARLDAMLANLQQHIDERTRELAQPHIDQARAQVAEAQEERDHWRDRFTDLQREMQRQLTVVERRASRAETAIACVRSTLHLNTTGSPGHEHGPTDYRRGYEACADHVTRALGEPF